MFGRRNPISFMYQLRQIIWPESGWLRAWQYLSHRLLRSKDSHHALALGLAVGVFASMTPFIGFHLILAFGGALLLRASLLGAAIGTVIGNPLTFPFIWAITYRIGVWMLGIDTSTDPMASLPEVNTSASFYDEFWSTVVPMLVGAFFLGLLLAVISYVAALFGLETYKNRLIRRKAK